MGIITKTVDRLKYPGLVLSFAVGNAFSLSTKLGLLNLPLGIAVAAVGFGAAIMGGIIHAPKTVEAPPAPATISRKKSPVKSLVNEIKNWISFSIDTVKTPEYVVGAAAAHGGYHLLFQAALGIEMCLTAALVAPPLMPFAIAGFGLLGVISLYSIIGGIEEQFTGVGKFYQNRFNKGGTIDPSKKNLIEKFVASPSVQKFIRQPLVQKFLNNKVVKTLTKAPPPKLKKILLTCMAVETSVFSLVASISVLMAGPKLIPLVLAGTWACSSTWGLVQAARDSGLLKFAADKIRGKKQTATAAQPANAPPMTKPLLFKKLTAPLRNIFKKSADRVTDIRHAGLAPASMDAASSAAWRM